MNKLSPLIYFAILLSINLSCAQTETDKGDHQVAKVNKVDFSLNTTKDSLLFTSGVSSILHDSKGNYWFGSHQEGLCLFDGKTFTYFKVEDGLSNNEIRTIQEDNKGTIWLGTGNGISSYKNKEITNHNLRNSLTGFQLKKESNWKLTKHDLWFNSGNEFGVYRYDGQELTYLALPKAELINSNNTYAFTGYTRGKDNQIWIATYAGVFGYNGKSFTIINDKSLGLKYETGYLHVRSILEDSKGNLWIGNNGIGVLLNHGDSTINFSEKNGLIHFASSRRGDKSPKGTLEHVFAIEEDSHGNIWFGDRDTGTWKYDGKTMTNYTKEDGLPSDFVLTIHSDRKGDLWFGTIEEGVYKFNGNTFERAF